MQQGTQQTRPASRIIARPDCEIKGRIVGQGILLGELAAAVGITPSALTLYIQGKARNRRRQEQIHVAFRAISRSDISLEDFWGELLSERIAG